MIAKKQFSYMRSVVLPILGLTLGVGVLAFRAHAANYYLDINGPTTRSGITSGGGNYNWDNPIWTTTSFGDINTINYVDGNFPRFAASTDAIFSYSLNLPTNHSCVGMILEDGNNTDSQTSFTPPITGSMV